MGERKKRREVRVEGAASYSKETGHADVARYLRMVFAAARSYGCSRRNVTKLPQIRSSACFGLCVVQLWASKIHIYENVDSAALHVIRQYYGTVLLFSRRVTHESTFHRWSGSFGEVCRDTARTVGGCCRLYSYSSNNLCPRSPARTALRVNSGRAANAMS